MEEKLKKYDIRKSQILSALKTMCSEYAAIEKSLLLPPVDVWPKTRDLADRCGESIYSARSLLIALENEGKIHCFHRRISNSLRWFICTEEKER